MMSLWRITHNRANLCDKLVEFTRMNLTITSTFI